VHILSFSEAIKTYGIARSTFYKYVTNGKLSVVDTPHNPKSKRGVQVSEVERVFGAPRKASSDAGESMGIPQSTDETVHRRAKTTMDKLVDSLYSQVENLQKQLEIAHDEKSRLLTLMETKLLSAPEEKTPLPTPPPVVAPVTASNSSSWSTPVLSQDERDELVVPDRFKKKKKRPKGGLESIDTEGMWTKKQKKKGKKGKKGKKK
jgi:hypothetical protein